MAGIGLIEATRSGPQRLDREDVGGGAELERFVPARPQKAAVAPRALVGAALRRGRWRCSAQASTGSSWTLPRRAPHLEQRAAYVGVLHAARLVGVPREARAPRAAAGLVVGHVGRGVGVVGRLRLPDDDAVAHVDLPGAGAGAVDAVGGAHFFVVTPAIAVELFGTTRIVAEGHAAVCGGRALTKVASASQQGLGGGSSLGRRSSTTVRRFACVPHTLP